MLIASKVSGPCMRRFPALFRRQLQYFCQHGSPTNELELLFCRVNEWKDEGMKKRKKGKKKNGGEPKLTEWNGTPNRPSSFVQQRGDPAGHRFEKGSRTMMSAWLCLERGFTPIFAYVLSCSFLRSTVAWTREMRVFGFKRENHNSWEEKLNENRERIEQFEWNVDIIKSLKLDNSMGLDHHWSS